MKKLFTLFLVIGMLFFVSCIEEAPPYDNSLIECGPDYNCDDYNSQAEAQTAFNANPECRADLDADNDGIACEENHWTDYYNSLNNNSGSTSDCPTTSNCGCSGHNKSPCEQDPCCKWVVGSGCECS